MIEYCQACIVCSDESGNDRITDLLSFDDLVEFLQEFRDNWIERIIEHHADVPDGTLPRNKSELAGFGVRITNRWESVVEVAQGYDVWFLFRHEPKPSRCCSDRPPITGSRVFSWTGDTILN